MTQMQPIGCGSGFGMLCLLEWAYRRWIKPEADAELSGKLIVRPGTDDSEETKPQSSPGWSGYAFVAVCLCLQNFLNRTGSRGDLVRRRCCQLP